MIINCEKCYKIIRPIEYFDMVNIFYLFSYINYFFYVIMQIENL